MIARILRHLPQTDIKEYNQYFDHREQKDLKDRVHGLIVITADKGLAGSYNHNVLKMAQDQMDWGGSFKLFVVGELGRQYFAARGIPVAEQFRYTAQNPTLHRARIISETILEQFRAGELDDVHLIYTVMKNGVTTETQMLHLLPLAAEDYMPEEMQHAGLGKEELVMKPSPRAVLDNIVPDSVMGYIYGALVESFSSEQNARMMAMEQPIRMLRP